MVASSCALILTSTKHTGECLRVEVMGAQIQGEPDLKFTGSIRKRALMQEL